MTGKQKTLLGMVRTPDGLKGGWKIWTNPYNRQARQADKDWRTECWSIRPDDWM